MFDVRVLPVTSSLILQILATIVLFLVLRHYLFGPVSKFLNDRRERIEKDLNDAKKKNNEASELQKEYQAKIEEAKKEAQGIIEAAKKRGEQLREEILENAKKDAANVSVRARDEIARDKARAMEELKAEVVTIAMMAASKVIDRNLDADVHKDMINQFINEVGERTWQS